jgi:23S rRNA A2030 N6-methylase RlmJ
VYTALAEPADATRLVCRHCLADYIVITTHFSQQQQQLQLQQRHAVGSPRTAACAASLRAAARLLLKALKPGDQQHLHVLFGPGNTVYSITLKQVCREFAAQEQYGGKV